MLFHLWDDWCGGQFWQMDSTPSKFLFNVSFCFWRVSWSLYLLVCFPWQLGLCHFTVCSPQLQPLIEESVKCTRAHRKFGGCKHTIHSNIREPGRNFAHFFYLSPKDQDTLIWNVAHWLVCFRTALIPALTDYLARLLERFYLEWERLSLLSNNTSLLTGYHVPLNSESSCYSRAACETFYFNCLAICGCHGESDVSIRLGCCMLWSFHFWGVNWSQK